jgi:soluble lytic murein transglycosylase-like protein
LPNLRSLGHVICVGAALLAANAEAGAQTFSDAFRAPIAQFLIPGARGAIAHDVVGDALRWLTEMEKRLPPHLTDRKARLDLLKTVQIEATRAGIDPQLVLAIIEVQSGFRRYAVSRAGARGYMQVMPFWTHALRRPNDNLFNPHINLRYGCMILRYQLDRHGGDYVLALTAYRGQRRGSARATSITRGNFAQDVIALSRGKWSYSGSFTQ